MNFEELKLKTTEISERIAYLAKFLKIADHRKQVKDLEEVMARPDFWDDKEKAQETVQKLSSEKNIVEPFAALEKHGEDFAAIAEFAAEDESFLAEADTALVELEKEIDKMELLSFLSGKFDRMNCFFFIHAGAGGTESCDWASISFSPPPGPPLPVRQQRPPSHLLRLRRRLPGAQGRPRYPD